MSLGDNIYNLRTARFMSQEELADMLGVSRQSVSKWETGASVPELDKLVKMSDLFEITLDQLVKFKSGGEQTAKAQIPSVPYVDFPRIDGKFIELVELWRLKSWFGGTVSELEKIFENIEKRSENHIWNPTMGAVPKMRFLGEGGTELSPVQAPVSGLSFDEESGTVLFNIPTDGSSAKWLDNKVEGLRVYEEKFDHKQEVGIEQIKFKTDNSGLICPMCGSDKIQAFERGFGAGKAAIGAILLGPIGLLAGAIGSDELHKVCMNCGHKF